MRCPRGRFEKQQTVLGRSHRNTSPTTFQHQSFEVCSRVVTKNTELQSVLALSLPMTAARIAASFCQDRNNLTVKRNRYRIVQLTNDDGDCCALIGKVNDDQALAINLRADQTTFVNNCNVRRINMNRYFACDIESSSYGVSVIHNNLLRSFRPLQSDLRWIHRERPSPNTISNFAKSQKTIDKQI